jgi:hypothetical protein
VIVDAFIEDVWSCVVEIAFEKVAVFPRMLDTVKLPCGFVIAAELRRNCDTWSAVIVL